MVGMHLCRGNEGAECAGGVAGQQGLLQEVQLLQQLRDGCHRWPCISTYCSATRAEQASHMPNNRDAGRTRHSCRCNELLLD